MPNTSIVPYHYHDANVDRIKNEITDLVKDYSLNKMTNLKKKYTKEIEGQNFKILDYERSFKEEPWYTKLNAVQRRDVEYQIASHIHQTVKTYLQEEVYNKTFQEISKEISTKKDIGTKKEDILYYIVNRFKEKTSFTPANPQDIEEVNCAGFANFAGEIYRMYGYEIGEFNVLGHTAMGVRINRERFISDINFNELKPIRNWVKVVRSAKLLSLLSDSSDISRYGGVSDASVHNNLGVFLVDLKQFEEAEKEYGEAIKINPNYAEAHYNLGRLLLTNLNRFEEAEKEYREAIKINPNYAEARLGLGLLLEALGRYEEAEEKYGEIIKINPNDAKAHNILGVLLYDLERYEEAEKEFKKVIEINPNGAGAQKYLEIVQKELKKSENNKGTNENEITDIVKVNSRSMIILLFLGIIATILIVLALLTHPLIDAFAILGSWLK